MSGGKTLTFLKLLYFCTEPMEKQGLKIKPKSLNLISQTPVIKCLKTMQHIYLVYCALVCAQLAMTMMVFAGPQEAVNTTGYWMLPRSHLVTISVPLLDRQNISFCSL